MAQVDLNKLIELMAKLRNQNQSVSGWLYSATRNVVHYKGHPKESKEIQKDLDHASAGLLIVYLFSLVQVYFSSKHWKQWLTPDQYERLRAWQHIRHCISHRIDGKRVDTYAEQFDAVMTSSSPLPGVTWNQSTDLIDLHEATGMHLKTELESILGRVMSQVASTMPSGPTT